MRLSLSLCSGHPAFHSGFASIKRMMSFRISLIHLLRLCLVFSMDHSGFCLETVWQPPQPNISHLQPLSDKQTLSVSWMVNHSCLVGNIYELQIGRTENRTIIYSRNISLFSMDSDEYTWTWTSDLPLECVDHSVRIRCFCNESVPSPWSNWMTNHGVQAKDKANIFPYQQVLREGTSAVFCCVPPRGVNITSITFNNNKYPLISLGDRVKAISVDKLVIPSVMIKALLLSCSDTTGKITYIWNYVSFPSQKPRNLHCETSDMTTVTCTWDSGRKRSPYDRNRQTQTLHIENSDQSPINCEQSSCTFPAIPQLEEYKISVMVKDQLGEERESYIFNISDRVSPVVEWDRVNPGVTDTTMSWIIQGKLAQPNFLCQVTTDPGSTTELSCNSGLCKVKLEHLLPNNRYSTRVRCSANGKFWGAWTQPISFTTYPLVTLDVWWKVKQMLHPSSRQVTLSWTPYVPGSAVPVNIQGYTVQWSQYGKNATKRMDSEQTQTQVFIDPGRCDITIKAVVHTGSSVPARITITKMDNGENVPVEKQLSSSADAGFNLSWDEQDIATCGYIVEWCILGNKMPCALQWMKVPQGSNTLSLPPGNFNAGCRYTFNIYGCTENGNKLLEIQTGYSQELKSVPPPSLVELVQSTSSSVTLEWRYNEDDPAHPAFITGYLVTAQEVGSDTLQDLFNMSVTNPRRKSVTVEDLQQNREYVFSVSALTEVGPGQPARITIRTRINYTAYLAKTLTLILLLLCCIILVWPRRRTLKSRLKGIFAYPAGMNIKPPEIDDFLHETCARLQSQEVQECHSCDIEILNTRPPLDETTTLNHPEPLNTLSSPSSLSLSCMLLQADYTPQSATRPWDRPALQQMECVTNKTYFHVTEGDLSETQAMFSEINEPFESLQESCNVVFGYISNETF